MNIKCEYCGSTYQDTDGKCPNCGAPNEHQLTGGKVKVPKTIDELKAFAEAHHLPLEKMRFFIGEDYREPKAFGIYQDADGRFVVYKNKANGERAIRYRGSDEAVAVVELYKKMKDELILQYSHGASRGSSTVTRSAPRKRSRTASLGSVLLTIGIVCFGVWGLYKTIGKDVPNTGYYQYQDNYYYYNNNDWYMYDELEDLWIVTQAESELRDNYSDYYSSRYFDDDYDVQDFSDSGYDTGYSSYSSDYDDDWDDDDWDWDSGSDWDSGFTDWDSDW